MDQVIRNKLSVFQPFLYLGFLFLLLACGLLDQVNTPSDDVSGSSTGFTPSSASPYLEPPTISSKTDVANSNLVASSTPSAISAYPVTNTSDADLADKPSATETTTATEPSVGADTSNNTYPTPENSVSSASPTGQGTTEGVYPGSGETSIPLTNTPINSLTPNSTQRPTITLTPLPTLTPTRTPIPPPAWEISNLQATNPQIVKLSSGKVQLIEFFAFWDGASLAMAPNIMGLEKTYKYRVGFIYLDIDDPATDQLKKELGYKSQPQIFLLNEQGEILKDWVGYVKLGDLIAAIEVALGS